MKLTDQSIHFDSSGYIEEFTHYSSATAIRCELEALAIEFISRKHGYWHLASHRHYTAPQIDVADRTILPTETGRAGDK
jgi:hypothetical protein